MNDDSKCSCAYHYPSTEVLGQVRHVVRARDDETTLEAVRRAVNNAEGKEQVLAENKRLQEEIADLRKRDVRAGDFVTLRHAHGTFYVTGQFARIVPRATPNATARLIEVELIESIQRQDGRDQIDPHTSADRATACEQGGMEERIRSKLRMLRSENHALRSENGELKVENERLRTDLEAALRWERRLLALEGRIAQARRVLGGEASGG